MGIKFDIAYVNWIKAAFCASLRSIFSSEDIPEEYRYSDDEEKTKILIYTAFPIRNFNSPLIVIGADTGNASVRSLGPQEQLGKKIIDNKPYLYFSGILNLSIGIDIYALSVTDVEKLIDFLTVFLRFFLRDKLAELKIVYTKINTGAITSTEWNGQLLYTSTITVGNCVSEYELIFPESLLGYIEKINITEKIKDILNNEMTINTKVES